jgi:exonuclease III
MSSSLNIYTLNLLSTGLTDPKYHNHCDPKVLGKEYRWAIIESRLFNEIKKGSIICLQEVCNYWLSKLIVLFANNDYVYIYDLYGESYNMGCCIAYSKHEYQLKSSKIVKIGDELKKLCTPRRNHSKPTVSTYFNWFKNSIPMFRDKAIKDSWVNAIKRQNTLILIELQDIKGKTYFEIEGTTSKTFIVGTYHMPCAFYDQDLMHIHTAMVLKTIREYATQNNEIKPYLLVGDFNLKPTDSAYKMITEGGDFTSKVATSTTYATPDIFNLPYKLTSAYKLKNGCEPKFTCVSHIKGNDRFIDCLDYIFLSSIPTLNENVDEEVVEMKDSKLNSENEIELIQKIRHQHTFQIANVLPTLAETLEESFPTATEPSDHIPLGAQLCLI